ncbi:MAG: ABC transporter permease [Bacteroidetes bacterium GWE2_39_28]|nr:MAG: ABC transporter permease [Bacteroidetes bacterium GWE2_39_28]OFY16060.1 MAG: ABC transporter permease [Bacteroidetes bacterium GWF2_39_10]OFZ07367.1 MAG: ABC transporter permease [Bacteroidetes bacterium RIFOXYB2_FULL_39_7]OFZ10085.1 MAG: ABC transporter permease [Bacteroidetes bacterium RIFOXYC2_FULL_39_11]HCT94421.1 ABC transporter permease [Rikenellaceae bacterium]
MLEFKLALKNLLGSGLRTWLNVTVLSIAFVIIIFYNGMLDGWNMQATNDTRAWETGAGQYWHPDYNPYDPFTFADSHSKMEEGILALEQNEMATPVLITQATGYPGGRLVNILLKGVSPNQKILSIPSHLLKDNPDDPYYIPAIIGNRMAQNLRLKEGERVLVRWRDTNGTFDAREVTITGVFKTTVPTIDAGQIWIPLEKLQELTSMTGEATYAVISPSATDLPEQTEWVYKDDKALLKDLADIMAAKKGSSRVISSLLLAIALLAIFDTQILSIFRRQKEIGTYIALGMTRMRVVRLFTIEGTTHSFLAILVGMAWGMPLLLWIQRNGIPMPANADQAGVAIADKITPYYGGGMIMATVLLVVLSSLIVSYMPTKRISKMKPTDALRGKLV